MGTIKNKVAAMLVSCWCLVSGLHRDDRGDNENLGRMLILALILIPLVILLGTFGSEIYGSAKTAWTEVMKTDVTKP
jgi:hypothetical protein